MTCPSHLGIRRVITTAAGTWWEHDLSTAAPTGRGRAVGEDAATGLSLGVALGVPARDRDQVLSTLEPHPEPVLAAVTAAIAALPERTRDQRRQAVTQALHRRAARPVDFDVPEAASVLEALGDVRVRDEAMVTAHRVHGWNGPGALRPRWLAPVATLAAVAVHQRGNSVLAQAALQRALTVDAGYRMALMMRQVLHHGLTPADVRRRVLDPAARDLGITPRP